MDKHPQITAYLTNLLDRFYKGQRNKVSNQFKTVKK